MNRRAILLMLLLIPALALAVPPEPNFQQFYGTVTGADEALSVKAQVGSKSFEATIIDGEYGKDTPFLVEGKEGDMITFFIDDAQVETYTLAIGEVTSLDLELKTGDEDTIVIDEDSSVVDDTIVGDGEAATTSGDADTSGELGDGEAITDTADGISVDAGEDDTTSLETEEPKVSQLEEEKKELESSNLFTYLIITGTAFFLGLAVLLVVFWKKGQRKQQQTAGSDNELFYGERCRHLSHQQYPAHKHERPAEVCRASEHQNYPPHRH